jgi:hypothetical protein
VRSSSMRPTGRGSSRWRNPLTWPPSARSTSGRPARKPMSIPGVERIRRCLPPSKAR